MKERSNLVPIKRAEGLPFTRATLYKKHSMKQLPEVLFKVDNMLCWDWSAWERRVEAAREKQVARGKKLREVER